MKRHTFLRIARFPCVAAPVCLLFTSCDPVDGPPSGIPAHYKAPRLDTRRQGTPNPETVRWLAAWRNLREELTPLQEKLSSLQEANAGNRFDSFLQLDPETLDKDRLCTLYQFLERGYFTVERRILLELLNRRLERAADPSLNAEESNVTLKDRFAAAMHRDELRMVDIETAIDGYNKAGAADLQIPNALTEAEREELLTAVNGMLATTRSEVAEMDAKIESLKGKLFPGSVAATTAPPAVAGEQGASVEADTAPEPSGALIIEEPAGTPIPAATPEPAAADRQAEPALFPESENITDPDETTAPPEPGDAVEPELP